MNNKKISKPQITCRFLLAGGNEFFFICRQFFVSDLLFPSRGASLSRGHGIDAAQINEHIKLKCIALQRYRHQASNYRQQCEIPSKLFQSYTVALLTPNSHILHKKYFKADNMARQKLASVSWARKTQAQSFLPLFPVPAAALTEVAAGSTSPRASLARHAAR